MPANFDDFIGQFVLGRTANAIPESWSRRTIGSWHLGTHATLSVYDILGADATVIGWLLGYPIDSAGHLVSEDVRFEISPEAADVAEQFESLLYTYGGRFAAVLIHPHTSRFYLDPFGSLAAVFCREQQIVASTSSLIGCRDEDDENRELIEIVHAPTRDTYFPFGLTARRSVDRMLPNHYLDLETWETIRHWPKAEIEPVTDVSAAVSELVERVKQILSAVANRYELYMSLTAGRDARMLLACAREWLDRIHFLTIEIQKPWGRLDAQVAPRIAKKFGLNYRFVSYEAPTEAEVKAWTQRTGGSITGSQWIGIYERLDPARVIFLGAGGELGRGFHWRSGDTESSVITVDDLLAKRELPSTPEIRNRARQWLEQLPIQNSLTKWGLLYNEQFNGCWFGPLFYGFISGAFYLCPFCDRRIVEIMLSLPTEYRRDNMLPIDVIESEWAELLRFPFNWPIGIRKYFHAFHWRWQRLKQKLRSS